MCPSPVRLLQAGKNEVSMSISHGQSIQNYPLINLRSVATATADRCIACISLLVSESGTRLQKHS
jgi:hypothetical protein